MKKGEKRYNDGLTAECRYYRRHKEEISKKRKGSPVVAARAKLYREKNIEKVREAERKRRIATKEWRDAYFAKNREKLLANKAIKYAANRDEISAARRKRYAEDRPFADAIKAKMKRSYDENPEKRRERTRAWAAANPEKARIQGSTKRARKRNATGNVSKDIAARLMTLQRGKCPVCRCDLKRETAHLDHIEPISRGGAHDDSNMQLLCKACNLSKYAKPPIEFMQSRGFLL